MTIQFADVVGKRVRYVREGSGEPLVLIHGLGNFAISWIKNIKMLAKHFTVYALDLPGHGYSTPLKKEEASLEFSSLFLESFFDELGLDQFVCAGASLGGLISLRYVLDYPGRVKKLVLVNSAGLGRGISLFLRIMTFPFVGEYFARPDPKLIRGMMERLVHNKECIPKSMVPAIARVRTLNGIRESMLVLLRYGVNILGQKKHALQVKELKQIKIPVLLLWGEEDSIFSVKQAYRAAKLLPDATLRVFPETGHLLPLERPREFEKEVIEFVLNNKKGGEK